MIRYRGSLAFRSALAALAVAAVTVALTGCTVSAREQQEQQAIAEGATSLQRLAVPLSSIPSRYYTQTVHWRACNQFECGSVLVPRNWDNPGGESIELALIEHKASGVAAGTLVVDPGGPGGSGVDFVAEELPGVADATIRSKYNLVGFDPRGVGYSAPVSCLSTKQLDNYIFKPSVGAIGSTEWIADQESRAKTFSSGCAKRSGSFVAHIDVVSIAHDLDVIRSALDESKLDYLGYSWGTYLGTVYAGLYPHNTGRIVLDGAYDPWSTVDRSGTAQQVGFEDDLNAYLDACLAGKSSALGKAKCPFSGTVSDADRSVSALLAAADKQPLAGANDTRLDGTLLEQAIVESLYSPMYWPQLTTMFGQLERGITTEAMVFIDARYGLYPNGKPGNNFEVAFNAMRCASEGSSHNLARDQAQFRLLEKKAPVIGKYEAFIDLQCDGWKYDAAPFPVPIHASGAAPLLVIGTTGDPATPYGEAKDLAKQLDSAHLVTYHGEGHTGYNKGNACVNTAVDDYLLFGKVPKTDPNCR